MGKKAKMNMIDLMVTKILNSLSPEKILLFGSTAQGNAKEDSDVDLMLIMNVDRSEKRKLKRQMYCELSGIGISKDIVIVTPEEVKKYKDVVGSVIFPAMRHGKVLYEKVS